MDEFRKEVLKEDADQKKKTVDMDRKKGYGTDKSHKESGNK